MACLASLLGRRIPVVVAERVDPSQSNVALLKRLLRPLLYRRRAATIVFQIRDYAASIFVFPSRFEGFPNALIEAMAMGKAVIASDLPPACREIVTHDTNGLLFGGTSPQELAAALRRLIEDAEARARLSEAAREVRTRYAEAAIFSLWEKCLAEAAYG